ncbi:divalent-cation tolerance protein CutA [Echinimonas agarilytica]|uniref:Divalent-cation tolerance protein CutA n=1 Tax=Echinimonas agarilytica TaxID=1215918 RepID=A0AA41W4A5_9GAMM|nr:divalent-cation tolerance protein CutA [Echinimonas agarilytica]MCM2678500.1 divalent-cation tolerance protein CutA [Echinimonas agarilytica]
MTTNTISLPTDTNPNNDAIRLVLTTCATQQQAETIAKGVLAAKLVACVNVIPNVQSWYQWQGKVCNDNELKLVIKTRADNLNATMAWLEAHHPYQTPEILSISANAGNRAYLQWIQDVC